MLTNEKSVIISDLGESPGVIFAVTTHGGARLLHRTLYKFTKFAIHNVKTRFPFLYASTSLDRNFDSCLSIRCLAPQQILRFFFFIFGAGVAFAFGNCAHYCVVLLNAPLSDRD